MCSGSSIGFFSSAFVLFSLHTACFTYIIHPHLFPNSRTLIVIPITNFRTFTIPMFVYIVPPFGFCFQFFSTGFFDLPI